MIDQNQDKKPNKRKIKLTITIVLLCVVAGYVYFIFALKLQLHKSSEDIIRQAVAEQLNKNPNKVNKKDFAAITKLDLSEKEVYNLRLLTKFKNLEELNISNIPLPEPEVPKWMVFMDKLHVIDIYERFSKSYKQKYFIDLTPLEKLSNLHVIHIRNTVLKDIKLLAKIKSLQEICIIASQFDEYAFFKENGTACYNLKEPKTKEIEPIFAKPEFKNSPKPLIHISIPDRPTVSPIKEIDIRIARQIDIAMK